MKYLITWAQNATPVHSKFWESLETYAKHNSAEILVVPGRYHNPTSHWGRAAQGQDWWAPEVVPHLVTKPRDLCRNLTVHGDVSIQPTAVRPLTGFEAHAGKASAIFGHPKIQLSTVPRPFTLPRIFTTTGACTRPNYIPSKAGRKAEKHHIYGACMVDVAADETYHVRQINATKDGAFYDLDLRYEPGIVKPAGAAPYIVIGDIHKELHTDGSWGRLLAVLRELQPRALVAHDVLDFPTRSHHSRKRWWTGTARAGLVSSDLDSACAALDDLAQIAPVYVVRSNHHGHLDRWLAETVPKDDPLNAPLWVKLWDLYYQGLCQEDAFRRYYECVHKGKAKVKWMATGESLRLAGVECAYHGDEGINGARGSATTFAKLGAKITAGHSHGPCILDGFHQVGVSAPLDAFGYRQGYPDPSLNTMGLIYPNGKRTLLSLIRGEYKCKG